MAVALTLLVAACSLAVSAAGVPADEERHEFVPMIRLNLADGGGPLSGDPSLVGVRARLGREDLETLDTLISVGIAASRAEGVRWALARIRERSAYEQTCIHAREIEDLKNQF